MRAPLAPTLLALALVSTHVIAAEGEYLVPEDVPPPPEPVEDIDELEGVEPEITIIQRQDAAYEEYRVNGRLYMIKVVPVIGPPYYYVDRDGDGLMESRMNDRAWEVRVPQWVIFSW